MTKFVKCSCPPKAVRSQRRFNLKYFNFGLGFILAVFGAMYLLNINDLTVKGFTLKSLQTKAASLSGDNLAYQEQVNALQSYYSLSARADKLKMVAVGDVEYLTVNRSAVAMR